MQFIFQKKSLILSVLFFLFSVFLFVFLYGVIKNNEETSHAEQEKWQMENTRREDIKSLIKSIKEIEPQRVKLDSYFVQSSDVVPFLNTIENLAKKVGISAEVTSVDISKINISLLVGMKATGSFENIYKFILLLENSAYDLEFDSVNIKNSNIQNMFITKKNTVSEWTADFQIKLLSFIK